MVFTLPLGVPTLLLMVGVLAAFLWMAWEPLLGPNEPFGDAPPGFRAVDPYSLEGQIRGRSVLVTITRRGRRRTLLRVMSRLGVPPDPGVLQGPQVGELRRELGDGGRLTVNSLELRFENGLQGSELAREIARAVFLMERYEEAALAPWTRLAEQRGLELLVGSPLMLRGGGLLAEMRVGRLDVLAEGLDKVLWAGPKELGEPIGNPVLDLLIGVRGPWPEGSEEELLAVVHGHPGSTVSRGRVHLVHEGKLDATVVGRCIDEARGLAEVGRGA